MILILDNYDSFTFNLFHLLEANTGEEIHVIRNDAVDPGNLSIYSRIILSPGPGLPEESGKLMEVISETAGRIPLLGVCLGHQAIGIWNGGKLINLPKPFHGVSDEVTVTDSSEWLFENIPGKFPAGRYHSWVLDPDTVDFPLHITACDAAGNVMAISGLNGMLQGIQFHPESIMSGEFGKQIIQNWLKKTEALNVTQGIR
jgi:anthranilate synthase component 2